MAQLAARVGRIDSSGIRKIFDLARSLKNPINLSIGQPDFDVPKEMQQAAIHAITSKKNAYTLTQGIPELRAHVAALEKEFTGRTYGDGEVLITSGVSGGLFLALLALVDDGDEVIVPDPYFVMYKHLTRLFGGVPVYLDTYGDDFGIDAQKLEKLITSKTKVLLLNTPSNPCGRVLPKAQLEAIAKVCAKHGIFVISDEIYRNFSYVPMTSMAEVYPNTLVLVGYSKTYGMTGWRLGYAAGPKDVIEAMTKVQQYSFVCAPSIAQWAALAQVWNPELYIDHHRKKRDLMYGLLKDTFEIGPPDGAFYLWAKAPQGYTGESFVRKAIEHNMLMIPGNVFSERDTHFRICYTVDDRQLAKGAELLCALAKPER
jgi:aspartate/methionine/tyrosine aminotransferase